MKLFDFSLLRRSVQTAAEQLRELRRQEEQVRQERDRVAASPACKADMKIMLTKWAEQKAEAFAPALQAHLQQFIRQPQAMSNPLRTADITVAGAAQPFSEAVAAKDLDALVCALFGDELAAALHRIVDRMAWEEGAPLSQRADRLAELDAQLVDLQRRQAQLVEGAEEAGVRLE